MNQQSERASVAKGLLVDADLLFQRGGPRSQPRAPGTPTGTLLEGAEASPQQEAQGSLGCGGGSQPAMCYPPLHEQNRDLAASCAPSDPRVPPNFRGSAMLSLLPRVVFSHLSLDNRGAFLRLCSNCTLTSPEPSLSTLSPVQSLSRV